MMPFSIVGTPLLKGVGLEPSKNQSHLGGRVPKILLERGDNPEMEEGLI